MPRRTGLDYQLERLQDQVVTMAGIVDKQVDRAIEALRILDHDVARQVIADDERVDQLRFEIEDQAIQLIATQQPMAGDLRIIVAVLSFVVDLERMGDHAEGIAKIVLMHGDRPLLKPLIDIPRMAERARHMLRGAIDAFVSRDAASAEAIANSDDEVDELYDQVYRELLSFMIEDPSTIDRATWLLWVAHNLERIADRATNLCERVVFMVTGRMTEINVSTY